jgi:hypothetical protein
MNTLKKFGFLALILILSIGCKKAKFKTNNSDFQNIYNELIDSGRDADVTWDAEVHAYTFVLSENKAITSIGYQSHEDLASTNYVIEVVNNSDSSIVYSAGHQFSSNDLSYVSPASPIQLQGGVSYTIKRIQTNWGQYITETVGHLVRTEQSDYPVSHGVLQITETSFYDVGTTSPWTKNEALPRIDIVLQ